MRKLLIRLDLYQIDIYVIYSLEKTNQYEGRHNEIVIMRSTTDQRVVHYPHNDSPTPTVEFL